VPIHDPIPDLNPRDKQFEAYLKTFRPLAASPLPTNYGRSTRRTLSVAGFALVAATILLVIGLVIHSRHRQDRVTQTTERTPAAQSTVLPLTIRSANVLLATSSSFKAAVDEMAFQPRPIPIPKNKLSALGVLSKEKIKL
jgi:hypothetical protein